MLVVHPARREVRSIPQHGEVLEDVHGDLVGVGVALLRELHRHLEEVRRCEKV